METTSIKTDFHNLIDGINNEYLLEQFYHALTFSSGQEGKLWDSLATEEQKEVLLAYEESKHEDQLLSHAVVKEKHKRWLEK